MSDTEVSETVIRLLNRSMVTWPNAENDRVKFIEENISQTWDALVGINANANLEVFSHIDDKKLSRTSLFSTCETASGTAWKALANLLMLVLVLEEVLGTTINISSRFSDANEISQEKNKIRARIGIAK